MTSLRMIVLAALAMPALAAHADPAVSVATSAVAHRTSAAASFESSLRDCVRSDVASTLTVRRAPIDPGDEGALATLSREIKHTAPWVKWVPSVERIRENSVVTKAIAKLDVAEF